MATEDATFPPELSTASGGVVPCGNVNDTSCITSNADGDVARRVIIATLLFSVTLLAIVGNAVVLIAFVVEKKLRNLFTCYIANLAVTDFLVGITAMLLYSFDTVLGYWPFGQFMCGVWIFFDYAMTFASVFTLVVISADRYWAVIYSVHYRTHNNKRKVTISIILIWVAVLALWLAPFIVDRVKWSEPGVCKWEPSKNKEFVVFVAIVGNHTPSAILVFCYVRVLVAMQKRRHAIKPAMARHQASKTAATTTSGFAEASVAPSSTEAPVTLYDVEHHSIELTSGNHSARQENIENAPINSGAATTTTTHLRVSAASAPVAVASHGSEGLNKTTTTNTTTASAGASATHASSDRDMRMFITLSYIIISYLVCWVPIYIMIDLSAIDPELVPEEMYVLGFWLAYANSAINPFLYAFSSRDFRLAFKKIIKCECFRTGGRNNTFPSHAP